MGGIALLVPNEEMLRQAHDVLQEMHAKLDMIKMIRTQDAVTEARQAISAGAEVIIARGLQASVIKQYTNIPVVEIVLTEESVEEMLVRAKRILKREHPVVAFVLFKNMTCDMSGIGARCGVTVREYYVQNPELLRRTAVQAIEDRADLIIGGETVLKAADEAGIPSLFLVNAEDAMRNAIVEAQRLAEAFDGTEADFSGGAAREVAENTEKRAPTRSAVQSKTAALSGAAVVQSNALDMQRGNENGRVFLDSKGNTGNPGRSAGTRRKEPEAFVNFPYQSSRMADCVRLAEQLSRSTCPKLIVEPVGMLHTALAAAIHNHSACSKEKLSVFECVPGEMAYEQLFGRQGLVSESGRGSIQINGIEHLDPRSQKRLFELILFRHIIAVSRTEQLEAYLLPELYYRLHAFEIRVPSLNECPEDIPFLAEQYMRNISERFGRYHVLTKDAVRTLGGFLWKGNRTQLESFLERLVLCAEHRSIGTAEVRALYQALYGTDAMQRQRDVNADAPSERDRVLAALHAHLGNRGKAAEALGISKSTLWRKMQQLGISE